MQNAALLVMLSQVEDQDVKNLPEAYKKQILEFTDIFLQEFDSITSKARILEWGEEDALILNVSDILYEEEVQRETKAAFSALNEKQQQEAETLTKAIFSVRKDKLVTFSYSDGEFDIMAIPGTIPKADLKLSKDQLFGCVCKLVTRLGVVVIKEQQKDGGEEVYGYRMTPIPMWIPIDENELREALLITPSGIELEPEDGAVYVCRPREIF